MRLSINSSSEEELIRACRRNNHKAQHDLYQKYCDRMFGICLRYVKNRFEAEDIMIKGFMTVFRKIDQYAGRGSFEGWMRRIMINEALEFIRNNKNLLMSVDIEYAESEPDWATLENSLETADLLDMIGQLPDGYRTVFNLYAIEGYNHKEIGELLGISEGASKSQLSRARLHLQKLLLEQEKRLKKTIGKNIM